MSFTATIIACHIALNGACMTITDNRGPYATEQQCKQRLEELVSDLTVVWRDHKMPMAFKLLSCTYPDGQIFT